MCKGNTREEIVFIWGNKHLPEFDSKTKKMKQHPNTKPDYKTIYTDILHQKFPNKIEECIPLLSKKHLSAIDILDLNQKIFGNSEEKSLRINQKFRSYSRSDILQILEHQKNHNLNNRQLANHFKLSRNTVARWKMMFLVS